MFDRLKTIFRSKGAAVEAPAPGKFAPSAPVEEKSKPEKGNSTASVAKNGAAAAPKKPLTPEELCGLSPKMNKEEVRARLAVLYRRYNRATSSLDTSLRAEAEQMLDAIVSVREKVFGPI